MAEQTFSPVPKTSVGKTEVLQTLRNAGRKGCTLSQLCESTGLDSAEVRAIVSNLQAAGKVVYLKGYELFFIKGNVPAELK